MAGGAALQSAFSAAGFLLMLAFWSRQMSADYPASVSLMLIVGLPMAGFPAAWVGRRLLNRHPTVHHAAWVITFAHLVFILLYGTAVFEAVKTGPAWPGWIFPFPRAAAVVLVTATSVFTLLTVVNLAVRALGRRSQYSSASDSAWTGSMPGPETL